MAKKATRIAAEGICRVAESYKRIIRSGACKVR